MDDMLKNIAITGVTFAGKAAWSYAATLALKKVTSFVEQQSKKAPVSNAATDSEQNEGEEQSSIEEEQLQEKLSRVSKKLTKKLSILTPIIDQLELLVAQGRFSEELQPSLDLTDDLKKALQALALLAKKPLNDQITGLNNVLDLVDELIPLLSLVMQSHRTTYGSGLKTGGGGGVAGFSFSRLLQASSSLVTGDAILSFRSKSQETSPFSIQVGPMFQVRLYTLFEGSARKTKSDWTWKEEYLRGNCVLERVVMPSSEGERQYKISITQNLNDGRYHDAVDLTKTTKNSFIPGPNLFTFNVSSITKMYYTSSGSLLNIEESLMPVLVLKVITNSSPSETPTASKIDPGGTPKVLAPKSEWIALELFRDLNLGVDEDSSDSEEAHEESEEVEGEGERKEKGGQTNQLGASLSKLSLGLKKVGESDTGKEEEETKNQPLSQLCLLEYLIRLSSMEVREGISHANVGDNLFNLYFESNTTTNSTSDGTFDQRQGGGGGGVFSLDPQRGGAVGGGGASLSSVAASSPLASRRGKGGGLMDRFVSGFLVYLKGYFSEYSTWA